VSDRGCRGGGRQRIQPKMRFAFLKLTETLSWEHLHEKEIEIDGFAFHLRRANLLQVCAKFRHVILLVRQIFHFGSWDLDGKMLKHNIRISLCEFGFCLLLYFAVLCRLFDVARSFFLSKVFSLPLVRPHQESMKVC
jgi:hypothetical protein